MPDESASEPAASGSPPGPEATPPRPTGPPAEPWETRFKYLLADFENFRKRADRDRETQRHQIRAQVLRELLPILEAFDRARSAVERLPPTDPVRRGLDLLGREWETFLRVEGVEPVARPGGRFSPDDHDAIAEAAASASAPAGSVVEVVQQGYRFPGGLLRPAKVVVARAPAPSAPAPATEAAAAEPPAGRGEPSE